MLAPPLGQHDRLYFNGAGVGLDTLKIPGWLAGSALVLTMRVVVARSRPNPHSGSPVQG